MKYILFHARKPYPFVPCIDGLFAAYAAKLALPDSVLVPAQHGQQNAPALSLNQGDTVFLLDLTYPAFVLECWADQGAEVIVLDHHKGAMQDLSGLSTRVKATFNMNLSGAVLAWTHFHPEPIPELFWYVQDRDLFRKDLPGCDLVHLALVTLFEGLTHQEAISKLLKEPISIEALQSQGEALLEELNSEITRAVKRARKRLIGGYLVPFVKCDSPVLLKSYSDVAHALLAAFPDAPFACVQAGGGWALRSEDAKIDVQLVAKTLGGNGHRNAAGCRAELPAWLVF